MKASDLFVQALENEGVEYIFGIPGEENLDLLDSIKKSKQIRFILTRHEQAAGFMAANYGRLTEKPGVCLSTLGPGLTNLVTSTAYALLGAMPSIIISGQKPILSSKQGRFQMINAVNMMEPICKWSKQIIKPDSIPAIIRESFRIAKSERPGPVHIELPEDIAAMESDHHLYQPYPTEKPRATKSSIEKVVEMITNAIHPLILIGSNANKKTVLAPLANFIKSTGIPFFATQMGKGVVSEKLDEYLGTAALSDSDILHNAVKKSDVIINIGHETIEKPPFLMEYGKYKNRQVIHINFTPAEIDSIYFPQHQLVGDIAHSVGMLGKLIPKQSHWNFDECHKVKENIENHLAPYSEDTRFPFLPLRLVKNIRTHMPEDGILCLDNGMYKIWFARNYSIYQQNTLLLDNAFASMGAGLATAIICKLTNPDKKVVAVCGDGGFMMNSQELETARRLNLDLTVVIINDSGYGMIKWKQASEFESFGLDFTNPDFVQYAQSYGCKGYKPTSDQEFNDIFPTCIQSSGIHVIDTAIDYSLDQQILEETSSALYA